MPVLVVGNVTTLQVPPVALSGWLCSPMNRPGEKRADDADVIWNLKDWLVSTSPIWQSATVLLVTEALPTKSFAVQLVPPRSKPQVCPVNAVSSVHTTPAPPGVVDPQTVCANASGAKPVSTARQNADQAKWPIRSRVLGDIALLQ